MGADPTAGPTGAAARVSLHGRRFAAAAQVEGGDVSAETVFDYAQDGDVVWARYAGGAVRLGHLVGRRAGDALDFRYSHLRVDGQTAAGHCRSTIHQLPDGRLQLQETWEWESREGGGRSVLEELPGAAGAVLGLGFAATATLRQDEMRAFAVDVLGMGPGTVPGIETPMFVLPDGSAFAVASSRGIPGGRSVGFLVADLEAAVRRLREAGTEVGQVYENPRDRYVHFVAPDGETYELVERRPT